MELSQTPTRRRGSGLRRSNEARDAKGIRGCCFVGGREEVVAAASMDREPSAMAHLGALHRKDRAGTGRHGWSWRGCCLLEEEGEEGMVPWLREAPSWKGVGVGGC